MSDLISRQDAIDACRSVADNFDRPTDQQIGAEYCLDLINEIPSTELEQKKGKWNFIGDNMFECTHCGVVYTTQQLNGLRNYAIDPYAPKFCPNCGAEME